MLIASLLVAGCSLLQQAGVMVVGEGQVTTETRQVTDFDKVDFDGGVRFVLNYGQPTSVTVAAQPNLLTITTTQVINGTLLVRTTRPYTTSQGVTVTVSVPTVSSITVDGGVSGTATGVRPAALAVDANGGASLTLEGQTSQLTLTVDGGARVDGNTFVAVRATVDLNGGASATVAIDAEITGSADGGASLTVLGNPPTVNVTTSGGASVHH